MKAAEEGSTSEAANTPVKVVPVRKPVLELKRPVTREDVPQLQSAANLLKGTLTGEFSERQLQCLAKDPRVGPLYKTAMSFFCSSECHWTLLDRDGHPSTCSRLAMTCAQTTYFHTIQPFPWAPTAQSRNAPRFGPGRTHSGCRIMPSLCSGPRVTGPAALRESNENCQQSAGKPRKFAACCSRHLCPTEQKEFIECIKATRDASACHEFRDGVERCGVRTSQRMLRAALSDDWF